MLHNKNRIAHLITARNFFFLMIFFFIANNCFALTASNIFVNTNQNNNITIDLSSSISAIDNDGPLTISISSPPSNGTASVSEEQLSIIYTPNTDYTGVDQITYSVTGDQNEIVNAVISITVGSIIALPTETSIPIEKSIASVLEDICASQSTSNESFSIRCNELSQATPEEVEKAMREIAPEEVATQNKVGNTFAQNQLRNIGSRLSALRQGSRGISLGDLSFNFLEKHQSQKNKSHLFFNNSENSDGTEPFGLLSNKLGIFASGNIGEGSRSNTLLEDGFNYDSQGLTIGADYRLTHQMILGVATGYANTDLDISDNGGSLDAQGLSLTAYGTYYLADSLYVDIIITRGNNDYSSRRNINYDAAGNSISERATGDTKSSSNAISLGAGYVIHQKNGFSVTLTGKVDHLNSTIESYKETGANELNLVIDKRNLASTLGELGSQLSYPISQTWGVLIPQIDISWVHEFSTGKDSIKGSFVDDANATSFSFQTDRPDLDYFRTNIGISAVLPHGFNAFIMYETILDQRYTTNQNLSFGARMELAF